MKNYLNFKYFMAGLSTPFIPYKYTPSMGKHRANGGFTTSVETHTESVKYNLEHFLEWLGRTSFLEIGMKIND